MIEPVPEASQIVPPPLTESPISGRIRYLADGAYEAHIRHEDAPGARLGGINGSSCGNLVFNYQ